MVRTKKYIKFVSHILYLIFLSYLVTRRSYKVVSVNQIDRFLSDFKYILIWTQLQGITDEGQTHFINQKCPKINCYLTKNRNLLGDVRYFDAIVFNLQDVSVSNYDLPRLRSLNQRYIFAANDSAETYPVCSPVYDDFFNWTWSYKLDSTIIFNFFSIYNIHGEELGTNFPWPRYMNPINNLMKNQFASKSKAAAIFLDKCKSESQREVFIRNLGTQLQHFNLSLDVFGDCGPMKCKKKTMSPCLWRLRKNYFFYLALEDSFSQDFVTDSVLYAYNNNAVPIVYGGAEYERFLPPGSYINAMQMTEEALAEKINLIIRRKDLYYEFFRWKNHYVIKGSRILDPCVLCQMLNNPKCMMHRMSYTTLRMWWNQNYVRRCADFNRFFML